MLRIHLSLCAPAHGAKICAMAPLPRPVDILDEHALVALDEIETSAPCRPSGGEGEGELPQHRGLAEHGKLMDTHARRGELVSGRQEMYLVPPVAHERIDQACGGRLDAPVKGEGATHERELHRPAITSSTSGKSTRLAASKL